MDLSQHRHITDQELAELLQGMDQAEQSGVFDGLFCRELSEVAAPASKEQLLQSIGPEMNLTKGFFRKIYGYEISYPGFKETAIRALEEAGCMKARAYYDDIIGEYQRQRDEEIRPVAVEYLKECDRKQEQREREGEETRKQKIEAELRQMSNSDLIALCANLTGVN